MKAGDAIALTENLLLKAGISTDNAAATARSIVVSDIWGIGSHGLMRLPFYLERIEKGGINPQATLKPVTDLPSLLIFDGENGMGHWQLQRAAEIASERAKKNGIAAVGVGRSNHCGALGIYLWPMLEAGLVGMVFSNGPAVMPPWGGNKPVLSTSPIAAGIPSHPPTIIDLATSAVARGKIAAKAQAGGELEEGWAFDKFGKPTTNPQEALAGMLAPLGGVKGYALAVLVESLTGALIGPSLSTAVPDMFNSIQGHLPQEISHFIIAIDAAAMSVDSSENRLASLKSNIETAGGRLPGGKRINPRKIDMNATITITDSVSAELTKLSHCL